MGSTFVSWRNRGCTNLLPSRDNTDGGCISIDMQSIYTPAERCIDFPFCCIRFLFRVFAPQMVKNLMVE